MPRQHYSSPMTAERQWRGCDATTNVFNDVNRRLCDDTVSILCFVWMVRDSLCGFRIEQGNTVLVATLAYEVKR